MDLFPATAPRGVFGSISAVITGGLSAALFAVALVHAGSAMIFLAYIAGIPLFLSGLSTGSGAALLASATGILGLYFSEPANFTFTYAIFNAVPAILLTVLALRYRIGADQKTYWYPEGFLMTALALYPSVIFLAAVIMASGQGGLLGMTMESLNQTLDLFKDRADPTTLLEFSSMLPTLARFMPAFAGGAWMIIIMICMICAQNVLTKQKWNLRPDFSLQALHIPAWMVFAVAITGLAAEFAPAPFDYIGINLSVMLGMPFFFVGLAVVHAWAATHRFPKVTLAIFYLMASIIMWSVLVVAALGVIDEWVNFRQRFAVRPKTNMS